MPGVVPIAHMSGGPKEDIITGNSNSEIPGFLCTTVEDYADAIIALLCMDQHKRLKLAALARKYDSLNHACVSEQEINQTLAHQSKQMAGPFSFVRYRTMADAFFMLSTPKQSMG